MSTSATAMAAAPGPQPAAAGGVARTVLHVAWLSVLLGITLELLLVLVAAGFGTFARVQPFAADLVQKISWSMVVCIGLTFGKVAAGFRPQLTGIFGLLAAPVGFNVARTLHKTAERTLGVASATGGPSPVLLASLKGVEYAVLGVILGWLIKKTWGNALAFVAAGFGVSVLFGGIILATMDWYNPQPLAGAALASRGVNELLFPVGCSLVLYAAEALARKV
jgi:hypothetical protein